MNCRLAFFAFIFSLLPFSSAQAASSFALELTPVKIFADKQDRIHLSYQENCGAEFAGFILRTSDQKELQIGVVLRRNHGRCADLMGMQEVIVPHLQASQFAGVTSINPQFEPIFIKSSPVQSINHVRNDKQMTLQALYTSQCGTALGLYFQPQASGYRFGIIEGRHSKFSMCNRSSKVVGYPHLNFSNAPYKLLSNFEDDDAPANYYLRRTSTRLMLDPASGTYRIQYARACNEAPVGLVRQPFGKQQSVSILVAHYPDVRCVEGQLKKFWSHWDENLPKEIGETMAKSFQAPRTERLSLLRPLSYNLDTKNSLEVDAYASCQKDVGIVSRSQKAGYAISLLQIQDSRPCNSPLKQVTYTYSWSFDRSIKREVKPLQLVGL